jgi:hypothetical protein
MSVAHCNKYMRTQYRNAYNTKGLRSTNAHDPCMGRDPSQMKMATLSDLMFCTSTKQVRKGPYKSLARLPCVFAVRIRWNFSCRPKTHSQLSDSSSQYTSSSSGKTTVVFLSGTKCSASSSTL